MARCVALAARDAPFFSSVVSEKNPHCSSGESHNVARIFNTAQAHESDLTSRRRFEQKITKETKSRKLLETRAGCSPNSNFVCLNSILFPVRSPCTPWLRGKMVWMFGFFFGCGFAPLCFFAAKIPESERPSYGPRMHAAQRHFEGLWYRVRAL